MTDNPLVEAVARAVCRANCPDYMTQSDVSIQEEHAWDMWQTEATAALRAIEDAGYRIEKVGIPNLKS